MRRRAIRPFNAVAVGVLAHFRARAVSRPHLDGRGVVADGLRGDVAVVFDDHFGEPLVRETPFGELAEHAAESRLRRDETRTVPSAEPARQGFGAEHPHELLRVLDVQHGLEEERLEDLQPAGRGPPVSLPLRVVELAGPDHRLADGPEQPVPGVEFADVVVDPGEESLVEFVPESADGAGA